MRVLIILINKFFSSRTLLSSSFLLLITACNGEIKDSSNQISSNNDHDSNPVTVYSQDAINQGVVGSPILVDLSDKTMLSNASPTRLVEFVSLSSNNSHCEQVKLDGMSYRLTSFDTTALCQYQYAIEDLENKVIYRSNTMISQLVVTETPMTMQNSIASYSPLPSAVLPPFTVTIAGIEESITINIKSQLQTNFPKDAEGNDYILNDSLFVFGSGVANVVEGTTDQLTFTSNSKDEGGITRVLYVLTDDFDNSGEGDFKIGSIDISVSGGDINQAPVAENFEWNNAGNAIIMGKEYIIDVASNTSSDCSYLGRDADSATNSCIKDEDNDDKLQLIDAIAYDAVAIPLNDLTTSFKVTFSRTGIHDISYYISDHNGGYDIGLVRVDIPHNIAPIFKGPHIVYVNSNDTITVNMSEPDNELVSDPDGDTVELISVSAPSSDKGSIDIINKSSFAYTPTASTSGLVPVKVTFTDGKAQSSGDVIFVVKQINPLSLKSERNFTTPFNTAVTIDIEALIDGLTTGEIVTVDGVMGSQLGNVTVDSTDKNKVIYTPTNNLYGVDDFAFEVKTSFGYVISGDIQVQIGTPSPLVINNIDAVEEDGDVIKAIVDCTDCDINKYEYQWLINGEVVSTQSKFKITPNQRAYNVVLIVAGEDAYGQTTSELKGFDFFKITVGTHATPASSCNEIYDLYNSNYVLAAQDGEYWIAAKRTDEPYLTQCDMVTATEAAQQGKQGAGGYTLVWSYSEKTNLERFSNARDFSQFGKGLHWGSDWDVVEKGRGLVRSENVSSVNYNDFRVTQGEANRLGGSVITRMNYTSDPSVDSIDIDDDDTVTDWLVESTGPVSFIQGSTSFNGKSIRGRFFGAQFDISSGWLYLDGKTIGTATLYNGSYAWHIDINGDWYAKGTYINNIFGYWGETMHDGGDLFGVCTNGSPCNGDTVGEMTYHSAINGGEGYVMQWWVK